MSRNFLPVSTWWRRTLSLSLVGLFVLTALGKPAVNSVQAIPGNIYTTAIAADPGSFDPAVAMDDVSFRISSQIYETLVTLGVDDTRPLPGLASAWTISADGLTWTFTIRSGVKFQDGTDLTPAAVLFNLERWWDTANAYHTGSFAYFEAFFGFKGSNSLISSMSANSTQVTIVLSRPGALASLLAYPAFGIASPSAIQAGTLATHPVGTGPFQFGHWTAGTEVQLDPYPDYQGSAPLPSSLIFKVLGTSALQLADLQSNSIQSAKDIAGADLDTAMGDSNLTVWWRPTSTLGYLGINQAHTPLGNLLVRQAIAHAIDKQTLIANYYNPGTLPAGQFLPASLWGSDPALTDTSYDPQLAISLLAQAGFPSGFSTTLAYRDVVRPYLPNPSAVANKIATDLEAVGIHATLVQLSSGDFITQVYNGDLDLYLLGWGADYLHPDNFFTPHFCNASNKQFGETLDSTLCGLVSQGLTQPTFAQQLASYQAASDRVYNSVPLVPLVFTRAAFVTRHDLGGVPPSAMGVESYAFAFTIQNWLLLPSVRR